MKTTWIISALLANLSFNQVKAVHLVSSAAHEIDDEQLLDITEQESNRLAHHKSVRNLNQQHHGMPEDPRLALFFQLAEKIDSNGDNAISESELEYALNFMGNEFGIHLSDVGKTKLFQFFASIDANGDNKVTQEEFMNAYHQGQCEEFLDMLGKLASQMGGDDGHGHHAKPAPVYVAAPEWMGA